MKTLKYITVISVTIYLCSISQLIEKDYIFVSTCWSIYELLLIYISFVADLDPIQVKSPLLIVCIIFALPILLLSLVLEPVLYIILFFVCFTIILIALIPYKYK